MPTPRMSDEQCREALDALAIHGNHADAAESLGMNVNKFKKRVRNGRLRGLHLSEGALAEVEKARLKPAEARGGWIHQYDEDGKKTGTTFWRAPDEQREGFFDRLREAVSSIDPVDPIAQPTTTDQDQLTLYPIADAHIGMLAWAPETGEDYNTATACARLRRWVGQCVDAAPPSETAVILDVGDLMHADDETNQTPRGKHNLDVDTRFYRTVDMTVAAMSAAIEYAAQKHKRVLVRILPGNHNPHSYVAVMIALRERYRASPQITIQDVPGEVFVHQFGKVLIAAHHGDKARADRLAGFISDQYAPLFGRTTHRYLWTGHLHHHKSQDIHGWQWEQLRALSARDAYAISHAYAARAQMQAVTYHRNSGEKMRFKVGAPDD